MEFYNLIGEPDDDDPCHINIHNSKGTHAMEGSGVSSDQFLNPLKIKNVNIDSLENLKFANIEDYSDDETIENITDQLHEF